MKKDKISGKIKRLKSRLAFVLLFFLLCSSITAQEALLKTEYSYRRYTINEGLPNHLFTGIYQDKRGFIWICSLKGLSRFDGFTFTPFMSETLINIYHINSLPDGTVKAFSVHDMYIIHPDNSVKKVRLVPDSLEMTNALSNCLPDNYIIYNNTDYSQYYLARLDQDTVAELIRIPSPDKIQNYSYPFIDGNNLYIPLVSSHTICIYNMRTGNTEYVDFYSNVFMRHSTLGLLGINYDGIYSITGNTYTKICPINWSTRKRIHQCAEMEDGSILFMTWDSLYIYKNGQIKEYPMNTDFSFHMLYDRDGNIWVTHFDGLYNYFHLTFENYNSGQDKISSIIEDEHGNIWFGAHTKLIRYKEGQYEWEKSLSGKFFRNDGPFESGDACCANGKLYFPTLQNVLIKDNNKYSMAKTPEDEYYNGIISLPDRQILIQSNHRLSRCTQDGELLQAYPAEYFRQEELFSLAVDKEGKYIVAGNLGVSVVQGDSIRLYTSVNSRFTLVVEMDGDNHIWSCSANCLNLLSGDSLITVHRFNDGIQDIKSLQNGYMAIATGKGIYLMDSREYLRSGKINYYYYDQYNGMMGLQPDAHGLYEDRQGNVWMPTSECLVKFNPQELLRKVNPPVLHILSTAFSTDNVHWTSAGEDNHFSHKQKNLRFSYVGLNFSAVENVRYHYRLPGFQNEWSDPVKNREVTFNNLPPGDYTFEIYADAGTEESRSETRTFAFSIKPAFWQTSWFLVLLILSLVSLSFLISLVFLQRKNRALLEKLRTEKELNELHISSIRLKAIPHFNANVLAAIEYYIANRTKAEAMRILGIYSNFTLKTLSDIDKAARPLSEELDYVKMYLDLEKVRFLEKFDFQINVEDGVDENVQLPNMILHTYCENAVKHGLMPLKSGGRLSINVSQQGQIMCVDVEDNGVGRESAARNPHLHSTKQGLSILNRQIEIYNRFNREKIQQQTDDLSSAGKPSGTRFSVKIPLSFTYIT